MYTFIAKLSKGTNKGVHFLLNFQKVPKKVYLFCDSFRKVPVNVPQKVPMKVYFLTKFSKATYKDDLSHKIVKSYI